MIKILHDLALFSAKNANLFAEIFGENILKIITSVPGHPGTFMAATFGSADSKRADTTKLVLAFC
jgi:hypothetical protein